MIQEIPHPRSRTFVAQSWNSFYILGLVTGSWVNFGCSYITGSSWQWVSIISCPCTLYPPSSQTNFDPIVSLCRLAQLHEGEG